MSDVSVEVIRTIRRQARKTYECNACLWLFQLLDEGELAGRVSFADYRIIVKLKRAGGQIRPGDYYMDQTQLFEGQICRVRFLEAADALCKKYELYP